MNDQCPFCKTGIRTDALELYEDGESTETECPGCGRAVIVTVCVDVSYEVICHPDEHNFVPLEVKGYENYALCSRCGAGFHRFAKAVVWLLAALAATSAVGDDDDDFPIRISRPRSQFEVDRTLYQPYQQRRTERRVYAYDARRQLNAGKVHRYRTAIAVPYNPIGTSAIEAGWVRQPSYGYAVQSCSPRRSIDTSWMAGQRAEMESIAASLQAMSQRP